MRISRTIGQRKNVAKRRNIGFATDIFTMVSNITPIDTTKATAQNVIMYIMIIPVISLITHYTYKFQAFQTNKACLYS